MFNKKRKGQITIFIIAGILLLIGAVTVFYVTQIKTEEMKTPTETFAAADIPQWALPVNDYIKECIQKISIKGLNAIGSHGGYIDLEDVWLSGRTFSITDNPTESDAVLFSASGFNPVMYWWYLYSPNDCLTCTLNSVMPSKTEIEGQMNKYINRELEACLDNFKIFREQGFEFDIGSINANTSIQSRTVNILVDHPIKITKGGSETLIPSFYLDLDLNLQEILELGFIIFLYQMNEQNQEDIILHLISAYSQTPNPNQLAPVAWIDHQSSTVTWNFDTIKENIKEYILANHIHQIQLEHTKDAVSVTASDPAMQGAYDVMFLNYLPITYPDLEVDFFYNPEWEIYLDITPRSGQLLTPETITQEFLLNILPSKDTNLYQFFYDISYPVIVTIRDENALNKYGEKGYTFRFALESNIRDNLDLLSWNRGHGTIGEVTYENVRFSHTISGTNQGECTQSGTNWVCSIDQSTFPDELKCQTNCYEQTETTTPDAQDQIVPTLMCNPSQRISKNITINVEDQLGNKIKEAKISFRCGNSRTCPMDNTDENGVYKGEFPFCLGSGFIIVEKEDHLTATEEQVSIDLENEQTFDIVLETVRELEAEVAFIEVSNMFRIKRLLYNSGMLNNIYSFQTLPFGGIDYQGILGEIYDSTGSAQIRNKILNHASKIENAKSSIMNIEHHYQANRGAVANAGNAANDAVNYAWDLVDSGTVSISASSQNTLNDYKATLNQETNNIQFRSTTELVQSSTIERYKNQATGLQTTTEQVIVQVQKEKSSPLEQPLPKSSLMFESGSSETVTLVPGKYNLVTNAVDTVGYIIPASQMLPPGIPGGIPIQPQEDFTQTFVGSSTIDDSTRQWMFNSDKLDSATKVRFYVFRIDQAENIEDIGEIQKISEEYNRRYRNYIQPDFLP